MDEVKNGFPEEEKAAAFVQQGDRIIVSRLNIREGQTEPQDTGEVLEVDRIVEGDGVIEISLTRREKSQDCEDSKES